MNNLKLLRIKSGKSQSKLADETGLSIRTLQMYEQGHREIANARIDVLLKICIALNCGLEELISSKYGNLYNTYKGD